MFKIQDRKEIVVEKQGKKEAEDEEFTEQTWKTFVEALPEDEPRYALVDIDYLSVDGRKQSKLTFIFWSPDDKSKVKDRMIYASSKDALKTVCKGIMKEIQANDHGDLEYATIMDYMQK